ncbi:membrane lipoprotein lipid attachment site-containing protein [Rodentibacter caecimuris]|uniref:membrane lipoprotein lipid attachment site-containing protein n=1 Tax=Rodentibacter caecimuris TaxID=1796644 RepID=UPI00258700E7|nr:membrane lipoprotein lipid attachment site-containing protein [Rodentibacter heylii]
MKKIVLAATMTALLSGCQLIEQIQGKAQAPSKVEATPEQIEMFKKLDEQFERVKKTGTEIEFNGEKYVKQTRAVKGDDPRFISLAVSVDRSNRKSVTSETFYLKDLSHISMLTTKYLDSNKKVCDLQTLSYANAVYYACDGNNFQRFIAVVHKEKNILSFRSLKTYQKKPTEAEENAIVKSLMSYPFDAISR